MGNYYFLAPSLPPLEFGRKPEISSEELASRLEINLSKEDFAKLIVLRRFVDLHNIRSLLLEEQLDPRGNLSEKELDEALLIRNFFPDYVFDFLNRYENVGDRIKNFSSLLVTYFAEEIPKQKGFMRKYLSFERDWRLVMLTLRAKKTGRDIVRELQFEDFSDPLVAQILAQKDADSYEPPIEYKDLKELFLSCGDDPWQQYKVIAKWRFDKIEEMVDHPLFSIDWILAYMARLMIVEYWNELDEEKGKMILETFKTG